MNHSPLSTWADQATWRWPAITIALVVLLCGSWALTQANDEIAYMQAIEADRVQAEQQALQEQIRQQALQDQCGGPESTVVELSRGGYQCLDTNGRKTKTIQRSPA